jgi:hypothetical protein
LHSGGFGLPAFQLFEQAADLRVLLLKPLVERPLLLLSGSGLGIANLGLLSVALFLQLGQLMALLLELLGLLSDGLLGGLHAGLTPLKLLGDLADVLIELALRRVQAATLRSQERVDAFPLLAERIEKRVARAQLTRSRLGRSFHVAFPVRG